MNLWTSTVSTVRSIENILSFTNYNNYFTLVLGEILNKTNLLRMRCRGIPDADMVSENNINKKDNLKWFKITALYTKGSEQRSAANASVRGW